MKKKRCLSLVLAVMMLLGVMSVPAAAADTSANLLQDSAFATIMNEDSPWKQLYTQAQLSRTFGIYPGGLGYIANLKLGADTNYDGLAQNCGIAPSDGYYTLSVYVRGSAEGMAALCMVNGKSARMDYVSTKWAKISYEGFVRSGEPIKAELRGSSMSKDATLYFAGPQLTLKGNGSAPVYGNLIKNPSFENSLANWTVQGVASSVTVDNYLANSGLRSIAINCPSDAARGYIEQNVTIPQVAGNYTFSTYFKKQMTVSGNGQLLLYIMAKDENGETVASNYQMASASGDAWTKASCSLSVPETAKTLTVQIQVGNGFGAYNVDDASLTYVG